MATQCNSSKPCPYPHPVHGDRYGKKGDSRRPIGHHGKHFNHNAGIQMSILEARRAEANARQAAWDNLSPQQQLGALKKRPGRSAKQTARILKRIEAAAAAPKPEKKPARRQESP